MKLLSTLLVSAIAFSASANWLRYDDDVKGTTGLFGELGYSHSNFRNSIEGNGIFFSGGLNLTTKRQGRGFYFRPGITYQSEKVSGLPLSGKHINRYKENAQLERVFGGFKLGGLVDLDRHLSFRAGALLEKEIWTEEELYSAQAHYAYEPNAYYDYFSVGAELALDFKMSRNFLLSPSLTWKKTFEEGYRFSDSGMLGMSAVVQF